MLQAVRSIPVDHLVKQEKLGALESFSVVPGHYFALCAGPKPTRRFAGILFQRCGIYFPQRPSERFQQYTHRVGVVCGNDIEAAIGVHTAGASQ